jgi:hypothetical protein
MGYRSTVPTESYRTLNFQRNTVLKSSEVNWSHFLSLDQWEWSQEIIDPLLQHVLLRRPAHTRKFFRPQPLSRGRSRLDLPPSIKPRLLLRRSVPLEMLLPPPEFVGVRLKRSVAWTRHPPPPIFRFPTPLQGTTSLSNTFKAVKLISHRHPRRSPRRLRLPRPRLPLPRLPRPRQDLPNPVVTLSRPNRFRTSPIPTILRSVRSVLSVVLRRWSGPPARMARLPGSLIRPR